MSEEQEQSFVRQMTVRSFWVSIAAVTVPLLVAALGGVFAFGNRQAAAEGRIAAIEQKQARQDATDERKAQADSETNIRLARMEEKMDAMRDAVARLESERGNGGNR